MAEVKTPLETAAAPTNPYVGPQQFDTGHAHYFFGRDREARDLLSVVIAHRLVLFYAPSGAGKSSLLKVRLIPGLRSKDVGYLVLPSTRVGGAPPEAVGPIDNIYAFNAMSSIDGRSDMYPVFSHMTLKEFMRGLHTSDGVAYSYDAGVAAAQAAQEQQQTAPTAGRSRRNQPPHVLILDQLEEIVTTHATRWLERKQFFEQINDALEDDPQLWVVLSMRSDYVAEIEHYAPELPNYTFVRFAMEHLDKEAAREAVEKPAAKAGRPIEADAVDEIVHNLLLVREQGQEDAEAREGPFVQPVQLQVVCYQMWEGLQKDNKPRITVEDLRALAGGDLTRFVDNALGDFYEERLHQALQEVGKGISEAELRSWFSNKLITTAKTRGFLYKGQTETEGIANPVVEFLENKYLLRVEAKASSYWYELVHDRFIEPIRARNREWERKELQRNPLLGRAHSWVNSQRAKPAQRDQRLLLRDDELASLDLRGRVLEPIVQEFIKASQQAKKDRDLATARQQGKVARKQSRVFAALSVLALLAFIVAVGQTFRAKGAAYGESVARETSDANATIAVAAKATSDANAATAVAAKATSDANAATAVAAKATSDANAAIAVAERKKAEIAIQTARSLELANQSLVASSIEDTLLLARAATTYSPTLLANTALLDALDYSYRLNKDSPTIAAHVPHEWLDFSDGRPWQAVAFSNDGRLLALSDDEGGISLWDNPSGEPIGQRLVAHQDYPVETLAFDPTGPRLASATGDRRNPTAPRHDLVLWDLADPEAPTHRVLAGSQPSIWSAAWSPDGQRLAVANQDGTVDLWNLAGSEPISRTLPGRHDDWAFSVAFDPEGSRLASAGKDGMIILWSELTSRTPLSQTLTAHTDSVNVVAFSPDGTWLASGSDDGALRLWELTQEPPSSIVLDDHYDRGAKVWDLAFSADGRQLAAGWGDTLVRVYDLQQPDAAPWQLAGHSEEVSDLAFDPAAPQRLVSLEAGGYVFEPIAWDLSQRSEFAHVQPFSAPVTATLHALGPNGHWLALSGDNQTIFVGETMTSSPAISFTTGITITAAALSASGDRLAFAGCKGTPDEASPGPSSTPAVTKTLGATQAAAPAGARPTGCQLTIRSLDPYVPGPSTRTITFIQSIAAMAFHPQRPDQLAIALDTGEVQIRNLSQPITITINLPGRLPEIADLAFASDGRQLAALGKTGLVMVWDWASKALVEEYSFGDTGEDRTFDAIEFVQGGAYAWLALASRPSLASESDSDTMQLELLERESGQMVEKFRLDSGWAVDLVFDPQSRSLIWVQPDGLVRWPMDPAAWLALACTRAGRNLNYEAWRVAFPAEAERDDTTSARICPYPLDVSFAEALVTEARTAIARCNSRQLGDGMDLLQRAVQMEVTPLLRLDALAFTLDVLGEQALEYLLQPSGLYQDRAAACLSRAAERLSAAGQTTFDPQQALSVGQKLVEAERLLADAQAGAGPIVDALEEILEADAPWPDDFLRNRVQVLLPQAYYRLCRQGDAEGCQRFTMVAELLEYGATVEGEYQAGIEEPLYFQGQRGQAVTIAMDAVGNAFDTLVRLEGAEGVLTSDDDSGPRANSLIDNYLLPRDGIFLIIPTAYSGEGSYLLSLQMSTPQPIALGVAESSTTDQNRLWQFDGQVDQLVAIAMDTDDPDFDPYLRLLGPDLTELKVDDNSGGNYNALIVATLPEDGLYYVSTKGCCDDAPYTLGVFEPLPLPFDQPQTSAAVSDTLWIFAGDGSQVVDLTITPADLSQQPRLTLRNARGDYLAQGVVSPAAGSERITAVVPGDDRLLVLVGPHGDQTPYTLTLTSIEAQPLAPGQPVTSTTQADPIWTFSGVAGQIVDITLNSARRTFDPALRLLDASGGEITYDADSGGDLNARIAAFPLPVDGQYFVTPLPAAFPVSYTLTLAQVTPQAITLGETVTSTLRQDTLWAFDGAAGRPIAVVVAVDTGESPSVALWTETGQTLAEGGQYLRDADTNSIDGYILPQAGRTFVRIDHLNQTTRYSLAVSEARTQPIQIGEAVASTTISDTLWTLDAAAGQALDITLSTTDGAFDPYLTIYAPNGVSLATDDDNGGYRDARISMFVAPTAGRYLVRAGRPGSPAPYTLSVQELQAPEIRFGDTEPSNTRTTELWQFAGQAGQVVDISLSGWVRGSFDPYLTLLGPDGSRLAENDDIAGDNYNARIASFILPRTGTYYIQTGRAGSTAPYRLALRQGTPRRAVLGSSPLHVQQSGAYALALDQPAVLRISADQPVELTLVGPGGVVLASQAPAILSRLDAAGTYTVAVSFPSGGPARQLSFERVQAAPQLLNAEQENRGETSPGATDLWILPGSDQRGVRLTASAAGFTPVVELWAAGGDLLAASGPTGQQITALLTAEDALLSVRADEVRARGPYTLTVQPVEALPGPQACNATSDAINYLPVRPGSIVILSRQRPVNGDDGWNPAMSTYVGRTALVTSLASTDWQGCPVVQIDIDQGANLWRVRDLVVIE